VKKILHIVFIAFFLLYAVTPIWYHIGEREEGNELRSEARSAIDCAPSLLVVQLLAQTMLQDSSDRTGLGSDSAGSGMLLKKKRAILSSKKSITPILAGETSADPNEFGRDRGHRVSVTPEIVTTVLSYFHHHSGSSPPCS